ncbi:MAG: hypothetical protein VB096_06090 [Pseudoflavonifractor sp.]|nr:hypothetical protein [Pseudoflavonifractor sp.]
MRGGRVRLLELVLDLCVFAVCALICVLLLVQAGTTSGESARLTRAVYLAQTLAEDWKMGESDPGTAKDAELIGEVRETGDGSAEVIVTWNGETVYTIGEVRRGES